MIEYIVHLAVFVAIYATLAVGWDLIAGHSGLLSLAHAAFFGIGSYSSGLLCCRFGLPFGLGLFVGIFLSYILSVIISVASLRLTGDFLVVATLGFQVIIFNVLNNWIEVTRGPLGISKIPPPVIFGWELDTHWEFLLLATCVAIFAFWMVRRITRCAFGRVLHALREDELFTQSLGKRAFYFKVSAFSVGAGLAATAGSIYAHYITYIDPTSFTVTESILIISMVIIGGAGSMWGALLGAVVLVTLPEILRFIGMPTSIAANVRQIIYGGALVAFMMWRPQGLLGKYAFRSGEAGE